MAKKAVVKEKSYKGSLKEVDDKMIIDSAEKEKYAGHKGPMPVMEVNTPYPKGVKKSDVDFIGDELVKLTNRVNELELSLEQMRSKINVVSGRMGL